MSGVIFKIIIPTEDYETLEQSKRKPTINPKVINETENDHAFMVTSSTKSLLKQETLEVKSGSTECLSEEVQLDEPTLIRKSMKQILEETLTEMKISNDVWIVTKNENYFQITFSVESRTRCEKLLNALKAHHIGKKCGSIISVIPCSIYYYENEEEADDETEEEDGHGISHPQVAEKEHMRTKSGWNRFVSSVRARLVVAQVAENIKTNAALTFDFACLLVIASILCAIGLVENSSMFLLSSMLISPMMRPVMAGTFGTVIGDSKLQKTGVQNEVISLSIATLLGFSYGVIICIATDKYGNSDWPTYEMTSRGEIHSLWVGCLVALLSGAAVALGILSDFIASLVGAAISTSLMPPAVNAGLLWALTTVYYLKGNETERYTSLKFTSFYSENKTIELAIQGTVSICLTFINIICIYIAGILIFKIKEVAPITSTDQAKKEFWNYNIKAARDYNKTLQDEDAGNIKRQLPSSTTFIGFMQPRIHSSQDLGQPLQHHSLSLLDDAISQVNAPVWESQYTWSPCSYCPAAGELKKYKYAMGMNGNNRGRMQRFTTIKQESRSRRLSSLFVPGNAQYLESPALPPKNYAHSSYDLNRSVVETTTPNPKMRFVVTPCVLDNANK